MLPALVLTAGLLAGMPLAAQATPVCMIGETPYDTLDDALAAVAGETPATITLLTDITHGPTRISKRKITFDLNGRNLVFTDPDDTPLFVSDNSVVDYIGAGTFQAIGVNYAGLFVSGGSAVTVTYVETGSAHYSAVNGEVGATVIVNGDINATTVGSGGVIASGGTRITVNGNITAGGRGMLISGAGSMMTVHGNVVSTGKDSDAITSWHGASVTVTGNVTAAGRGITAMSDGAITVTGDVMAAKVGIEAEDNAAITVIGHVVSAESIGVVAQNAGTRVSVNGTVVGTYAGAYASDESVITVSGNVTRLGQDEDVGYNSGAYASDGATITVGGNLTSMAGHGAFVEGGGKITVEGIIKATPYVLIGCTEKTIDDFTTPTTKEGYKTYSDSGCDDISTVWVKDQDTSGGAVGIPALSPALLVVLGLTVTGLAAFGQRRR